jgi:hypothetical protein
MSPNIVVDASFRRDISGLPCVNVEFGKKKSKKHLKKKSQEMEEDVEPCVCLL